MELKDGDGLLKDFNGFRQTLLHEGPRTFPTRDAEAGIGHLCCLELVQNVTCYGVLNIRSFY
jgi:hypothetical protein